MPAYCEVALPVPLDHTFTYGVRLGQLPQRGARVIVPFRNEKLIGVVTALGPRRRRTSKCGISKLCSMRSRCSATHLLELAEWTAQYYLAPLGEVLRAMLPLRRKCAAPSTTALPIWAVTCWPQPSTAIRRREIEGRESASRVRAVRRSFLPKGRMWSVAFSSGWLPVSRSRSPHCAPRLRHRCRFWPPWCARSGSRARPLPPSAMRGAWSALPCSFPTRGCPR